MKKLFLLLLVVLTATTLMAIVPQTTDQTGDILGAHNAYGRGCVSCHAPHSGPAGNGLAGSKAGQGNLALWGQDLSPLYNQKISFGDWSGFDVTMPAGYFSPFDATTGIMMCLSCHDGNLAKPGMMKGNTVETLPIVGGTAPTLLGNDGSTAGNYNNDHPVGPKATVGCAGYDPEAHHYDWDCTIVKDATDTKFLSITPEGGMVNFVTTNYGFTAELFDNGAGLPMVTCISCHDQHSQNIYAGTITGQKGYYKTMFFVRGYYNPTTGSNSVSQFCRQCHGGESNEQHGQLFVPTT